MAAETFATVPTVRRVSLPAGCSVASSSKVSPICAKRTHSQHNAPGPAARSVLPLVLLPIGTLILLRAPRNHRSLYLFLGMALYSLVTMQFQGGPRWITYTWMVVFALSQAFYLPIAHSPH